MEDVDGKVESLRSLFYSTFASEMFLPGFALPSNLAPLHRCWQPGTCTGDLNLLLAIVKNIVDNTLVLSTSTMKAASGSISKVSQKLDRGEKTNALYN